MASIRLKLSESGVESQFLLTGEDALIGRAEQGDIVVSTVSVSGRHGLFRAEEHGYTYTDLGSRNGSAYLASAGQEAQALAAGKTVSLASGMCLLLGDQDSALRVEVEEIASPYAEKPSTGRTIISEVPLSNLLPSGPADLANLSAKALTAEDGEALAEAALAFMQAQFPHASAHSAFVCGTGFSEHAGAPVPAALDEAAKNAEHAILFEDGSLPTSGSVARVGVRAAAISPLVAGGGWHGYLLAWTSLDSSVLPASHLQSMGVAASLLALAAQSVARRMNGERERLRLEAQISGLAKGDQIPEGGFAPIGHAPAFVAALELAGAVARSDISVLLHGETGTGKEVLARSVHGWSPRAKKPFVAFNCAAVPESLVESELFGHVRGSFTGASTDRPGLFEEADGGTIFLDEIGEMPAVMQAKLLRVLQDGEIRRVGATKVKKVDVRVLSATHQDLHALVEAGRFRSDLMYRLNAVTIEIPALRARRGDVLLLAHHLLHKETQRIQKPITAFSPEAVAVLGRYQWPGNVRELQNEVSRGVALTHEGGTIQAEALSPHIREKSATGGVGTLAGTGTLKEAVEAAEKRAVQAALTEADENVSQAARLLGLSRPGLYKLMERLGLR